MQTAATAANPQAETANEPATLNRTGTPEQIAGAMIRSMLGNSFTLSTAPAPNASAPSTNLPANPDASIPAGLPPIAAASVPIPANLQYSSAPVTQVPVPRKPARNTTGDAPASMAATALFVPTPALPPPANPAAANSSPSASVLSPAEAPAPASGPAAPQGANPPVAPSHATVAFTAVLTPVKEIPSTPPAAPVPGNQSPAAAAPPSNVLPPPVPFPAAAPISAAEPLSAAPHIQTAEAQNPASPPQAATDGSSQQQPGQQQTAPETPPQVSIRPQSAAADPKLKPLPANAGETAAQPAAPSPPDHGTIFPPPVPAAAADSPRAASPASAPSPAAPADALRNAEAAAPPTPQARTGAAQEISIRIAPPGAAPVDLRVTERSGQVRVDVRTADTAMQTALRQNLGTLTNSLERAGYHAEVSAPAGSRAASASPAGSQDSARDSSRNGGGSPDFTGGRRQQQQQKRTGNWLEQQEDQP